MGAAELERLGLYDPRAPDAAERLELLGFLLELGASNDDLVAYRDALPALASVLSIRGGPALTVGEVAARSGVPEADLRRLYRAAGFPDPGPEDRVLREDFARVADLVGAAEPLFGEPAVLQLVRVMGAAMARVADAVVSAFLVNVEPAVRGTDPVGLAVARANSDAAALLPGVAEALDSLLRQHLVVARRSTLDDVSGGGYERQRRCVGFVDLVGSTSLAQRLSMDELGGVLVEFENVAADLVTAGGGRVVKLIGDEILYVAGDERAACAIARALIAAFARHPRVPPVRAGIASGDVLLRDGDVYGPVVNLAARAVKTAAPGEIVAPAALARAAELASTPLGPQPLKGFDDDVELCRVLAES